LLTRLQPRYSWILLKEALNTINHQISRNWKKIIIKFFVQVLSVALTITSIVLSVVRGIIPIIFFYFRIKLGMCKRSDICQLWLSMTSVWRILWVSNPLGFTVDAFVSLSRFLTSNFVIEPWWCYHCCASSIYFMQNDNHQSVWSQFHKKKCYYQ
jgi:hypothetical protein